MTKIIAHIDGDMLKWTIGAACEDRHIVVTHKETGRTKNFPTRTEFSGRGNHISGWLGVLNKERVVSGKTPFSTDDFTIKDIQVAQPIQNCLHSVKVYIESIKNKLNADEVKIYIGDGECFRHEILTPVGRRYKENRADVIKPLLAADIIDYLVKRYDTTIVKGVETDDKLSMISYKGRTQNENSPVWDIVVTVDKDQGSCEGWWFNPKTMDKPVLVEGFGKIILDGKNKVRGLGRLFKYFQLLNGDPSDGYSPSRTPTGNVVYGEKSAYKDLSKCTTDKKCWEAIIKRYKQWIPDKLSYTSWNGQVVEEDWLTWLQKHWDFVHMMRWEGDKVDVRKVLDNLKIPYKGGVVK